MSSDHSDLDDLDARSFISGVRAFISFTEFLFSRLAFVLTQHEFNFEHRSNEFKSDLTVLNVHMMSTVTFLNFHAIHLLQFSVEISSARSTKPFKRWTNNFSLFFSYLLRDFIKISFAVLLVFLRPGLHTLLCIFSCLALLLAFIFQIIIKRA